MNVCLLGVLFSCCSAGFWLGMGLAGFLGGAGAEGRPVVG